MHLLTQMGAMIGLPRRELARGDVLAVGAVALFVPQADPIAVMRVVNHLTLGSLELPPRAGSVLGSIMDG